MPNKWLKEKGVKIKKQKYQVSNWAEYNSSLKNRGNIELWLSQDLLNKWYFEESTYYGTGSSKYYKGILKKIMSTLNLQPLP